MSNIYDERQKVLNSLRENCSVIEQVTLNKQIQTVTKRMDMFVFDPKEGEKLYQNDLAIFKELYMSVLGKVHVRAIVIIYRYDKIKPSNKKSIAIEVEIEPTVQI